VIVITGLRKKQDNEAENLQSSLTAVHIPNISF